MLAHRLLCLLSRLSWVRFLPVLVVPFDREGVTQFNPEDQHLILFLARQGGRFRVLPEDNSLAKIEPPSWLTRADLEAVTE